MAGKRTVFSSGAVDIREPGTRAVGACSFFLDVMLPLKLVSWLIINYTSHKAIFCHASCCQKHGRLDSLRSCFGSLAKPSRPLYRNLINHGSVLVTETTVSLQLYTPNILLVAAEESSMCIFEANIKLLFFTPSNIMSMSHASC